MPRSKRQAQSTTDSSKKAKKQEKTQDEIESALLLASISDTIPKDFSNSTCLEFFFTHTRPMQENPELKDFIQKVNSRMSSRVRKKPNRFTSSRHQ